MNDPSCQSLLATQANVPPADIPVSLAFLSFTQFMGIAVWLVVGNTIFGEVLRAKLVEYAPNVSVEMVIGAGATAFREIVSEADLPKVLLAYSKAGNAAFYLAVAAAVGAFLSAWGLGWVDIRKKKTADKGDV